jgi:hypothetical protein
MALAADFELAEATFGQRTQQVDRVAPRYPAVLGQILDGRARLFELGLGNPVEQPSGGGMGLVDRG